MDGGDVVFVQSTRIPDRFVVLYGIDRRRSIVGPLGCRSATVAVSGLSDRAELGAGIAVVYV